MCGCGCVLADRALVERLGHALRVSAVYLPESPDGFGESCDEEGAGDVDSLIGKSIAGARGAAGREESESSRGG